MFLIGIVRRFGQRRAGLLRPRSGHDRHAGHAVYLLRHLQVDHAGRADPEGRRRLLLAGPRLHPPTTPFRSASSSCLALYIAAQFITTKTRIGPQPLRRGRFARGGILLRHQRQAHTVRHLRAGRHPGHVRRPGADGPPGFRGCDQRRELRNSTRSSAPSSAASPSRAARATCWARLFGCIFLNVLFQKRLLPAGRRSLRAGRPQGHRAGTGGRRARRVEQPQDGTNDRRRHAITGKGSVKLWARTIYSVCRASARNSPA